MDKNSEPTHFLLNHPIPLTGNNRQIIRGVWLVQENFICNNNTPLLKNVWQFWNIATNYGPSNLCHPTKQVLFHKCCHTKPYYSTIGKHPIKSCLSDQFEDFTLYIISGKGTFWQRVCTVHIIQYTSCTGVFMSCILFLNKLLDHKK